MQPIGVQTEPYRRVHSILRLSHILALILERMLIRALLRIVPRLSRPASATCTTSPYASEGLLITPSTAENAHPGQIGTHCCSKSMATCSLHRLSNQSTNAAGQRKMINLTDSGPVACGLRRTSCWDPKVHTDDICKCKYTYTEGCTPKGRRPHITVTSKSACQQ